MAEPESVAGTGEKALGPCAPKAACLLCCGSSRGSQRESQPPRGPAGLSRSQRRGSRAKGASRPPGDEMPLAAARRGHRRAPIAARERSRVQTLHQAFLALQAALPTVPPGTKLSKLDTLLLATSYITHLSQTLQQGPLTPRMPPAAFLHPLKKWPMRCTLYVGSWPGGRPSAEAAVAPLLAPSGWAQMGPDARGAQP
ncbi:transcription factor 23 [Lacerta agilis]|uniref:transcription factor 23 n=1 Tax=Lacerta agilis TaxID=80427 RepID=UPI0014193FBB|nr:transcription factor 23 [Lacerta agilis]